MLRRRFATRLHQPASKLVSACVLHDESASSHSILSSGTWWNRCCGFAGRHSRSAANFGRSIPTSPRCRCHTRPFTPRTTPYPRVSYGARLWAACVVPRAAASRARRGGSARQSAQHSDDPRAATRSGESLGAWPLGS